MSSNNSSYGKQQQPFYDLGRESAARLIQDPLGFFDSVEDLQAKIVGEHCRSAGERAYKGALDLGFMPGPEDVERSVANSQVDAFFALVGSYFEFGAGAGTELAEVTCRNASEGLAMLLNVCSGGLFSQKSAVSKFKGAVASVAKGAEFAEALNLYHANKAEIDKECPDIAKFMRFLEKNSP
jgi:hypothetical protein